MTSIKEVLMVEFLGRILSAELFSILFDCQTIIHVNAVSKARKQIDDEDLP